MDDEETQDPMELIAAFSRCQNWPADDFGRISLAQGLRRASERTGVPMLRIVEECGETSRFCPTDADLFTVAQGLKGPDPVEDLYPRDDAADKRSWKRELIRVPHLPDGKIDMVSWTADCVVNAVESWDGRAWMRESNAPIGPGWTMRLAVFKFWKEVMRRHETLHPLSVASVRAGGKPDREEILA